MKKEFFCSTCRRYKKPELWGMNRGKGKDVCKVCTDAINRVRDEKIQQHSQTN